ncbi:hypothetical protein NQ315_015022 [Exocentrus adspersus]|uniref:R3H domain-containing protein n=1 Tax=Exocentrus adspersus TaxID=1586481 RepID=A0AAV8VXB5_9CUCU|nr:hypothetical protein NQ315_015022 [Exocentrus adspersus]
MVRVASTTSNINIVVVFPVLGPNYLKAVRYQAKIFDLAVFTLGTGRNRAIAVCQKEFLRRNSNEVVETTKVQIMPETSTENNSTKLRKKRPERQLYVPPAQRKLPSNTETVYNEKQQDVRNGDLVKTKKQTLSKNRKHSVSKEVVKSKSIQEHTENLTELSTDQKQINGIKSKNEKRASLDYLFSINYICILWHYQVAKNYPLPDIPYIKLSSYFSCCYTQLPLYSTRSQLNILYILHKNLVLWQPKLNVCLNRVDISKHPSRTYPLYDFEEATPTLRDCGLQKKMTVFSDDASDELKDLYRSVSRSFDYVEHTAFRISWNKYQCVSESDSVIDLSPINCGHSFIINNKNGSAYFYECNDDHDIVKCYLSKKDEVKGIMINSRHENGLSSSLVVDQKAAPFEKSSIILLEDQAVDKSVKIVKKNNDRNSAPNINNNKNDLISNNEIIKSQKESSEHEQEKEIMRKAKENINRKSRPIMKYVDDSTDMLKIDRNDKVNNWEELFDDDGQLQDELFKEVVHKVGTDVTILKAKEDYSEYFTKQSEDLEHMVELYDFPPTLETHDIIQAFSIINSEAMYVKWVDDTHAILVLGSLKQAQRAVELDNPLIKARPMTVASAMTLATAYKHDLKPAMKRPQTNLQTARRLITTHLGTKTKISKEQNAKERNDLKAARELKRLAKKNEQDAWDGNPRSVIN